MTTEVRPLGVKCNIQCQYCYQNSQRDAHNLSHTYDIPKMKAAIEREGGPFTLFGGEPLMVPEPVLDDLLAWGVERYGSNGIQTNGTLITDNHIRMFKQHRVDVGISVDGPGVLNDARWAGTTARTTDATQQTHAAIARLCGEGVYPSLIVTLHRNNATSDKLPMMHQWMRELEQLGVSSVRLHVLEVDTQDVRQKYALTIAETVDALLSFYNLEQNLQTLRFDLFWEMRKLLLGDDRDATCVWRACDPYSTPAVRGVESDGQTSNCGRTNKDGIDFTKSPSEGFERYVALYNTPQEYGGCGGCRFFLMCKGQCPGTAIGGDWRNRTEHCEVWKSVYSVIEQDLVDSGNLPLSQNPVRSQVECLLLDGWARGVNSSTYSVARSADFADHTSAQSVRPLPE